MQHQIPSGREVIEIDDSSDDEPSHRNPEPAICPPPRIPDMFRPQSSPFTEDGCLTKILDVMPDICHDHVRKLFQEHMKQTPLEDPLQALMISILDAGNYPKEKEKQNLKRKREADDDGEDGDGDVAEWQAPGRQLPTAQYCIAARAILQDEFPSVPVKHIHDILDRTTFLFTAYFALEAGERTYGSLEFPPYKRLKTVRKQKNRAPGSFLLYEEAGQHLGLGQTTVERELMAARKKRGKDAAKRRVLEDSAAAEAANEKEHMEAGMMMECQCCFSEWPINRMTHCNGLDTHFFCLECARRNAEVEIGRSRYEVKCMDGSGCDGEFDRQQIARFLDRKTVEKLERLRQQEEIRLAGLDDLSNCPFCDFAAIYPSVEEDKEFRCENPECQKVSCRLCNVETHVPLSCEEYAKDNKVTVRHLVEEAMTEALVRSCNKCKNKFIKEDGCNKMVCTRCGNKQCYVCSKSINNYDHFNDVHRGGAQGNCPLFDDTEKRHIDDVKKAEEAALAKIKQQNPEISEDDLKIQVSDAVQRKEQQRLRDSEVRQRLYDPGPHLGRHRHRLPLELDHIHQLPRLDRADFDERRMARLAEDLGRAGEAGRAEDRAARLADLRRRQERVEEQFRQLDQERREFQERRDRERREIQEGRDNERREIERRDVFAIHRAGDEPHPMPDAGRLNDIFMPPPLQLHQPPRRAPFLIPFPAHPALMPQNAPHLAQRDEHFGGRHLHVMPPLEPDPHEQVDVAGWLGHHRPRHAQEERNNHR
ncbi:MAG: hypothetical protein M1819_001418 [Sarea resinae]|nr:MAG: hypothetical protein M1819_001418 [Sarea resinae]